MVYAIIFSASPDHFKIGYTGRTLVDRYGGLRKMEEYWTWKGDKNAEGALRCLMGLNPVRGLDWFTITEERYLTINELRQDYLDVLADRVLRLRACTRCQARFILRSLFAADCTVCGHPFSRSPIMGQAPSTALNTLRASIDFAKYHTVRQEPEYVSVASVEGWVSPVFFS